MLRGYIAPGKRCPLRLYARMIGRQIPVGLAVKFLDNATAGGEKYLLDEGSYLSAINICPNNSVNNGPLPAYQLSLYSILIFINV